MSTEPTIAVIGATGATGAQGGGRGARHNESQIGSLPGIEYGRTVSHMVSPRIKSTYSLDPQTVRDLERLARKYGTSKSDILNRAVRLLAAQEAASGTQRLHALEELQKRVGLTVEKAEAWANEVRSTER